MLLARSRKCFVYSEFKICVDMTYGLPNASSKTSKRPALVSMKCYVPVGFAWYFCSEWLLWGEKFKLEQG